MWRMQGKYSKQAGKDISLNYCQNCDQYLCGNCGNKHNGKFYANKGDFQQQIFLRGPTGCKEMQYQFIDPKIV